MRRALLALLILLSIGFADAQANPEVPAPGFMPGERPADAQMNQSVDAALNRWRERGFHSCDGIVIQALFIDFVPESIYGQRNVGGFAPIGGCAGGDSRVWFVEPKIRVGGRYGAALECLVAEHEIGHLLGLNHSDADAWPVMSAQIGTFPEYCVPPLPAEPVTKTDKPPPGEACLPAWAGRTTRRIANLWWEDKMRQAMKEFRAWKKKHPKRWKKVANKGDKCMKFDDNGLIFESQKQQKG